jgi:hypothetical protein
VVSPFVAQAGFEPAVFLPPPPECWNYIVSELSHLTGLVFNVIKISFLSGKFGLVTSNLKPQLRTLQNV